MINVHPILNEKKRALSYRYMYVIYIHRYILNAVSIPHNVVCIVMVARRAAGNLICCSYLLERQSCDDSSDNITELASFSTVVSQYY